MLYESNRKSYKDAEKKSVAWNEIAGELGMPGYRLFQYVITACEQKCIMMWTYETFRRDSTLYKYTVFMDSAREV